jgi:hypothetical protein
MYRIRYFFHKVVRAFQYAKKSWGIYDYDYSSSLIMFEYALSRTEKILDNGHAMNSKDCAKNCLILRNLLRRIINSDINNEYSYIWKEIELKYGERKYSFVPSERTGLSKMVSTNPLHDTVEYRKACKRAMDKITYLEKRDLELAGKIFTKHITSFWD